MRQTFLLLPAVTAICFPPKLAAQKQENQLAVVAIPDYANATGSANDNYLGPTLSAAIDSSMQKLTQATPEKTGEKLALTKVQAPTAKEAEAKPAKKWWEDTPSGEEKDRSYVYASWNYHSNYFERHTQFYRYPSSMNMLEAGLHWQTGRNRTDNIHLYGQLALPESPSGSAIPLGYQNSGFWAIGLGQHSQYEANWLNNGILYRSFHQANPAGVFVRDVLDWSLWIYANAGVRVFSIGAVNFGLTLASNLDIFSTTFSTKPRGDLVFLWNLEGGTFASYLIPILGIHARLVLDTSFAVLDDTAKAYTTSPIGGTASLEGTGRAGKWSGLRYHLLLNKRFGGLILELQYFSYPAIRTAFQPVDARNRSQSSLSYIRFSISYRLAI
ncbi:MAG: hypothetical protein NZL89_00055 [Leptospiraceae bacterium]|nr:hypothetical protein [Leptospiraceae bacterium]